MHSFGELVYKSTVFSLDILESIEFQSFEELQTSTSTTVVKTLKMIQLNKSIMSIGMFSLFESVLQSRLNCKNGFKEAKKILIESGNMDLNNYFEDFISAINVLKHGKGRSYDKLIKKISLLPFRIKLPDEDFFDEGDISEVETLIEVDNKFVLACAKLIEDILCVVRLERSDFIY